MPKNAFATTFITPNFLKLNINKMNETMQKLLDYANVKDDWYIKSQLGILKQQIALEITKAELRTVQDLNNFIKK
jgi:hypothetical protein